MISSVKSRLPLSVMGSLSVFSLLSLSSLIPLGEGISNEREALSTAGGGCGGGEEFGKLVAVGFSSV